MAPGDRSRVNENTQPARMGRGLDHETQQAHTKQLFKMLETAEQLVAQDRSVADVCRALEVSRP